MDLPIPLYFLLAYLELDEIMRYQVVCKNWYKCKIRSRKLKISYRVNCNLARICDKFNNVEEIEFFSYSSILGHKFNNLFRYERLKSLELNGYHSILNIRNTKIVWMY